MAIDEIPHHPFTLRQLQYIVAVADELSFSKAAERCRVAQPSLSTQVAQVEDALGLQLFERDRRRVLVTLAGEEFIERARSLLTEADDLVDTARRAADPFSGTLRLGVIPTVAAYALPHLTPHLRARLPGLTILWTEDRTSALRTRLEAGQLDAAFWALEADLGAVEHVVVAIDPFVLATSATDPLGAEVGPLPLEALQDRDVLLLDDGHCLREQAISHCARAGARERAFRATSLPTLCQMVAAGAGVTLLPALAAAIEGGRSALRLRPLTDPVPSRTLILAWRRRAPMARALAQLAGHMREGLEGTLPSCIPLDPPRLP
ncbi:MAG: LysR substrate-binding domain-containing protein [Candidatus Sericytochromatia bacterium]|nr:LysR substrate-binding domain-containing protein [Candidatus Sericytochromatia bacterium]